MTKRLDRLVENQPTVFSDDDYDFICMMLEFAESHIARELAHLHRDNPAAALCATYRKWLHQSATLTERIEAR